jgi:hypothetical protein
MPRNLNEFVRSWIRLQHIPKQVKIVLWRILIIWSPYLPCLHQDFQIPLLHQSNKKFCQRGLPKEALLCHDSFTLVILHKCRLPDSVSRGVVFRLRISPRIRSPNRNGSKFSVRNLCRTDFCKTPRKSASLPCPFIKKWAFELLFRPNCSYCTKCNCFVWNTFGIV